LELDLNRRNRTGNRKRWNVDKFYETVVERYYQQEVQWKLQEKPPSNDTKEEWTCIKETLITTVQSIIGEKQYERNKHWFDEVSGSHIEVYPTRHKS
jgi:hypothetical protein